MKPIFGIDVTLDKKNEQVNGEEFITRVVSSRTRENFEAKTEKLDGTVKKSQLPGWLQIVKYLLGVIFLIVLAGVLKAGVGLEEALNNAARLIILGAGCGVGWAVLQVLSKQKEKTVLEDENANDQVEEINRDMQAIYNELEVPSSAIPVDVFAFRYAVKNGEIKLKTAGVQMGEYFNLEFMAYVKDGYLHLANLEDVHSFRLDEIKSIRIIKKHTTIMSWNKELGPNEEPYKSYKLTVDQYGIVHMKSYNIMEIEHEGQLYGLYFPVYERDSFERLTGLVAEQ